MMPERMSRLSQSVLARANRTPKAIVTSDCHSRPFFCSHEGCKLTFLKGSGYGEEEEKAARVDFKRAPRAENYGTQENKGIADCEEAEENRRRYAPEGFQHWALARLPFLIFQSTSEPHRSRNGRSGTSSTAGRGFVLKAAE